MSGSLYIEATRLRIYKYAKDKCGKTKNRNNFDRSSVNTVTRQQMRVTKAKNIWAGGGGDPVLLLLFLPSTHRK
jgi:hypothetical protein